MKKIFLSLLMSPMLLWAQDNVLRFDGQSSYLDASAVANDLATHDDNFTIETIFRTDYSAGYPCIFAINNPSPFMTENFLYACVNSNDGTLLVQGLGQNLFTNVRIDDNQCHHLAAVIHNFVPYIYLDGVLMGNLPVHTVNSTPNGDGINNNTLYWIGREYDPPGQGVTDQWFKGEISNYRVWNDARSSTEIVENMHLEVPVNTAGLIANYTFNQGVAYGNNTLLATIADVSGSSNDGVPIDFAMQEDQSNFVPNYCGDGNYCCDGINQVLNGNFEVGNTEFSSGYAYNQSPDVFSFQSAQYAIVQDFNVPQLNPNWDVTDHSACDNFLSNNVMLVNGNVNQPFNSQTVVYRTDVPVDTEKIYTFCASFMNLKNCLETSLPRIRVEIVGGNFTSNSIYSGTIVTLPNPNNPCDWYNLNAEISPTSNVISILIHLFEDTGVDGNDIAIDDIFLTEKKALPVTMNYVTNDDPMFPLTNYNVTASLNSISPNDDNNAEICEYIWTVNTYADAGATILINSETDPSWQLTTDFGGKSFLNDVTYEIILEIRTCDGSCYSNKTLTETFRASANSPIISFSKSAEDLTDQERQMLVSGGDSRTRINEPTVSPNPTEGKVNILFSESVNGEYSLYDSRGIAVKDGSVSDSKSIDLDITDFPAGQYLMIFNDVAGTHKISIVKR